MFIIYLFLVLFASIVVPGNILIIIINFNLSDIFYYTKFKPFWDNTKHTVKRDEEIF